MNERLARYINYMEIKYVFAHPNDDVYMVAKKFAIKTHQQFEDWNSELSWPQISIRTYPVYFTIILSNKFVNDDLLENLNLKVAKGILRYGIITGNKEAIIHQLKKPSNTTNKSKNWLLADNKFVTKKNFKNIEKLNATSFSNLQKRLARRSAVGIILGHGREDVVYFESYALCGWNTTGSAISICKTDYCPYPQKKILASTIAAEFVALLSCSAARISNGLFPLEYNLVNSLMGANTKACIAPFKLFTIRDGFIEYFVRLLESHLCISDIVYHLGSWYKSATGEENPFIALGNPGYVPIKSPLKARYVIESNVTEPTKASKLHLIRDNFIKIYQGIQFLKSLNPHIGDLEPVYQFFIENEMLLSVSAGYNNSNDAAINLKKLIQILKHLLIYIN